MVLLDVFQSTHSTKIDSVIQTLMPMVYKPLASLIGPCKQHNNYIIECMYYILV